MINDKIDIEKVYYHWLESSDKDFYKKCTPDFTAIWIDNIKTLREWIKMTL